jgi:uncharacterized protein (TIGR02444 family)
MAEADSAAASGGSPFWRFSLGFYRRAGVAQACIALQDESGVDVNLLLFLLWCAREGRQLSAVQVAELDRACAPWRSAAVIPLRAIRRGLKVLPALIEPGTAELYRGRIKAVELEAERLQQEALYRRFAAAPLGDHAASAAGAARGNLAAYAQVHDKPFGEAAMARLMEAFAQVQGETNP